MEMYIGLRRNECPPHIFGVAEGSYQGMCNAGKNQSILITGESGAGKTENTKKVISYFATIGASGKKKEGEPGLEDKIVQTNPVLEAWGNAKTVRNDNSSRFGKFIRIWFNQAGKLSGADMVVYLLEKSRLTFQAELERCYHSFYNLMSDQVPDLKEKCILSNDIYDYWFVSQGKLTVPSIDDKEDMMFADEAYDILGFTNEEKYNIYKLTSVVMHMGNLTKDFVPVGKEEQAEIKDDTNAQKVATLCGIDTEWMITYFCKPKLKVGTEWVSKGQTCSGAGSSVAGIGRKIYELVFRFMIEKCNETLIDPTMKKVQYIGCLDIAGFEIFDYNGFEQLCINFCNEKLQQFFNHHMFVLEQEEYMKEGIDWAMVDFGMDLQQCIDMFERPMGVLSILEEESLFPKATDKSFEEKLKANHLGKSPTFLKPKPGGPDKDAHFAVVHYAGTVNYNLTNWLEKNKDPLNDSVVDLMKNCKNALMPIVFKDLAGHSTEEEQGSGKKKKGGGKTVSSFYKEQLFNLMTTLHSTEPHFIRCIVPNTHKEAGVIDSGLVMHQLTCNGVLEGIRICRKGFPNRMVYKDFQSRYGILNLTGVRAAMATPPGTKMSQSLEEKQQQAVAMVIMKTVGLEKEKFRLGHTKVFFRVGVLGMMEEFREERVSKIMSWLQSAARGKLSRLQYQKLKNQKVALLCVQRSIRNYMVGKQWLWWKLWMGVKPTLKCYHFEEIKQGLDAKKMEAESKISNEKTARKAAEAINQKLEEEKAELERTLAGGSDSIREIEEQVKRAENAKRQAESEVNNASRGLQEEEETNSQLSNGMKKLDQEMKRKKDEIEMMNLRLQKANDDKVTKDSQIRSLKDELMHQDELIEKLQREKKNNADGRQKIDEEIQAAEDKANHLNRVKAKLEQNLDELEDSVEREKKSRNETEKLKKKSEMDLRLTQEAILELEKNKNEINVAIQMKDKELAAIAAKIEDEQR